MCSRDVFQRNAFEAFNFEYLQIRLPIRYFVNVGFSYMDETNYTNV